MSGWSVKARRSARSRAGVGWRRADRVTIGLAIGALATAGSVMLGELARFARRRAHARTTATGVVETAGQALGTAALATQDTLVVAREGYESTPRQETVMFNLLSGFVLSFAVARISTHGMRGGWWPVGPVRVQGRHIHHFVPGIVLAFSSGAAGLVTTNRRLEEVLAVPLGAGIGLTFDEAALLLDFRDVYWTREGVLSVQLSLGGAAVLGGTILALRMLRRGERRVEELGAPWRDPREVPDGSPATS